MLDTMLSRRFNQLFDTEAMRTKARELTAIQRLRSIEPLDMLLAVVACAMGDEQRSIAAARRQFERLTGYMPEESSFYDRFNPGFAKLAQFSFETALASMSRRRRREIGRMLGAAKLIDLLAVDASQCALPQRAAGVLPSTNRARGGFKITALMSVMFQRLVSVQFTSARCHDRKAFVLPEVIKNRLLLMDRGYSDHRLFADIDDRDGFFLTRLKESSMPTIATIRTGLGQKHVGDELHADLPYRNVCDFDCEFRVGEETRLFRVVYLKIGSTHLWFVTNLDPDHFDAQAVATIYRMRWEIELLFKRLKTIGRVDQIQTGNPDIVHAFTYASLLGLVLSEEVCAEMRRSRPGIEPSPFRVYAVLLGHLPLLLRAFGTPCWSAECDALIAALWREGANPNPGRQYKSTEYARAVAEEA